jgi:hypothetical protein
MRKGWFVRLFSYFFALCGATCILLMTNVLSAEHKIAVDFDNLYHPTPYSTALHCCMQLLGELKRCERLGNQFLPESLQHYADSIQELKDQINHIDLVKNMPADVHYLARLADQIEHMYKRLVMRHQHIQNYARCCAIVSPVIQAPQHRN